MKEKALGSSSKTNFDHRSVFLLRVSTGQVRLGFCLIQPDPNFSIGRKKNQNRLVMMVGLSGSGTSGLCPLVSNLAASADISLDWFRTDRYLARSIESGLDLDEISPDLVDFKQLFVRKAKISPVFVNFCQKNL